MAHQYRERLLFRFALEQLKFSRADDGGEEIAVVAGLLMRLKLIIGVHLKADKRVCAHNVELAPFFGAVAIECDLPIGAGVTVVERDNVRLLPVDHGKTDDAAAVKQGKNRRKVKFAIITAHHRQPPFSDFLYFMAKAAKMQ